MDGSGPSGPSGQSATEWSGYLRISSVHLAPVSFVVSRLFACIRGHLGGFREILFFVRIGG